MADEYDELSDDDLKALVVKAEIDVKHLERATAFARWHPFPHQVEWVQCASQVVLLLSGNQVGKSTVAAILAICEAIGFKPLWFGGKFPDSWPANNRRGVRILMAAETWDHHRKTTLAKLWEFLTLDMLDGPPGRNPQGIEYLFRFKSGALLELMTYDQDRRVWEGTQYDFVLFDEPPPREKYNATFRGVMKREGRIFIAATPLSEPWMKDELIDPSMDPEHPMHDAISYFRSDIWQNAKENGGCLSRQQIERFLVQLPENERAAREQGLFLDLQGLEFGYVDERNVIADFALPAGWPVVMVADPSYKRGLWCGWFTVAPDDKAYWVHAAHIENSSIPIMCRELRKHDAMLPRLPKKRIMDSRGGAHEINKDKQEDWFKRFKKEGFDFEPSRTAPMNILHSWLKGEPRWEDGELKQDVPRLRLFRTVAEMDRGPLWAFRRFLWNPEDSIKKQYNQPGKDWVDLAHYLAAAQGLTWQRLTRGDAAEDLERPPSLVETYAPRKHRPSSSTEMHPLSWARRTQAPSYKRSRPPIQRGYS